MSREYLRPVLQPATSFDWVIGADEAGAAHRVAHETSWALLDRVRGGTDPEIVDRVVRLASGDGLHDVAELWASQSAHTLAGVLWRLYLLRRVVEADPEGAADQFQRGAVAAAATIDPVVAGAADPVSPTAIGELCDTILRGVFVGDLGAALDRAASYSRVMALGAADLADERDQLDDAHAAELTTRALRYSTFAQELQGGARRWRDGSLA